MKEANANTDTAAAAAKAAAAAIGHSSRSAVFESDVQGVLRAPAATAMQLAPILNSDLGGETALLSWLDYVAAPFRFGVF